MRKAGAGVLDMAKTLISLLNAFFAAAGSVVVYQASSSSSQPASSSSVGGSSSGGIHGAPGPLAGVGLPVLAVGYGLYWLTRRRRAR